MPALATATMPPRPPLPRPPSDAPRGASPPRGPGGRRLRRASAKAGWPRANACGASRFDGAFARGLCRARRSAVFRLATAAAPPAGVLDAARASRSTRPPARLAGATRGARPGRAGRTRISRGARGPRNGRLVEGHGVVEVTVTRRWRGGGGRASVDSAERRDVRFFIARRADAVRRRCAEREGGSRRRRPRRLRHERCCRAAFSRRRPPRHGRCRFGRLRCGAVAGLALRARARPSCRTRDSPPGPRGAAWALRRRPWRRSAPLDATAGRCAGFGLERSTRRIGNHRRGWAPRAATCLRVRTVELPPLVVPGAPTDDPACVRGLTASTR